MILSFRKHGSDVGKAEWALTSQHDQYVHKVRLLWERSSRPEAGDRGHVMDRGLSQWGRETERHLPLCDGG